MIFGILCICSCLLMWLICFLKTGSDTKNLKNLQSYPLALQEEIKKNPKYKDKIPTPTNPIVSFISNLVLFGIILFLLGIFIRTKNYVYNFIGIFSLGQIINMFDLFIIDMLWFTHSRRTRFTYIPEKEKYLGMTNHAISFARAMVLFTLIAVIDAGLLLLF